MLLPRIWPWFSIILFWNSVCYMGRKRLKDVNFFSWEWDLTAPFCTDWLPWNHGSQLNNLSASRMCSPYSKALSFHLGSSAGLHPCWAHISCVLHTGEGCPCLLCVCRFLWWGPARRKASRPGMPGSSQTLGAPPAVILGHVPVSGARLDASWATSNLGVNWGSASSADREDKPSIPSTWM